MLQKLEESYNANSKLPQYKEKDEIVLAFSYNIP